MKQFSGDIELQKGLETDRCLEQLPKTLSDKRKALVRLQMGNNAWEWLIKNDLEVKLEGMPIIQSYLSAWATILHIQVLINTMDDIDSYRVLFESDPNWELYNEERDIQKRVNEDWSHGSYLRFNYSPTREYTNFLSNEFGGKPLFMDDAIVFSQYNFDVYLDFFPAEDGDCAITKLGEVTETTKRKIYEVTCGEGANEMREILNGS